MITFTVIRNDKFIYHNVWSIIVKVNSKHIIYCMSLKNQLLFTWASYVILVFLGRGGGIIQVTIAKLLECQNFIKT